jgi:hypothetical protein
MPAPARRGTLHYRPGTATLAGGAAAVGGGGEARRRKRSGNRAPETAGTSTLAGTLGRAQRSRER